MFRPFFAASLNVHLIIWLNSSSSKALTLIVIIRLLMMGEHESAVKSVCNETRMFSEGRRESLAAWLPDVLRHNLPELIDELDTLRTKATEQHETKQVISANQ